MSSDAFDVYVDERLVGTLVEQAGGCVFTYLPDVPADCFVSLLMPVRAESYVWKTLHPFFQQNLPEGYRKDRIRDRLGPHADVSDIGLLALTGANGVGRVRVVPRGQSPYVVRNRADMAALLASTDSRENLLRLLEEGIGEGISGVMPKTLLRPLDRATAITDEFVLKTGFDDLPWIAVNEYLCLEVARYAGLGVPEAILSEDGQVLALRRFDRTEEGGRLAVEDYCALMPLDPVNKYKGTLEDLAKLGGAYIGGQRRKEDARRLYTLHLLNFALRNADAHLKNFAVIYTNAADVRLAPVYDVVTVTAYARFQHDLPALPLAGKRVWASGALLGTYGGARLNLSKAEMNESVELVTSAVQAVAPQVRAYADRFPGFREIAKRMLDAWAQGIEDIRPNAAPGRHAPKALREDVGLSASRGRRVKEKNPYLNHDGPFNHKSR